MYVCMYVCMYARIYECVYVCIYVCIYIYLNEYATLRMRLMMPGSLLYIYIYMYIYIHTHHTYTHIHTYTPQVQASPSTCPAVSLTEEAYTLPCQSLRHNDGSHSFIHSYIHTCIHTQHSCIYTGSGLAIIMPRSLSHRRGIHTPGQILRGNNGGHHQHESCVFRTIQELCCEDNVEQIDGLGCLLCVCVHVQHDRIRTKPRISITGTKSSLMVLAASCMYVYMSRKTL
jgi:hypothetical protein